MKDFLLEIGTEEIPAGYIPKACADLESAFKNLLADNCYKDIKIETFATPRRLAILITNMAEAQQDRESLRIGPPRQAAFDEQGNPTKAALGFAKSQGVSLDNLTIENTPRGEYVAVARKEKGETTQALLTAKLPEIISGLPFPKSMRWADKSLRFARPIHWIVALLGEEVLEFDLHGIQSSNESRGHRFLSPKPFKINRVEYYQDFLQERKVIANPDLRKEEIRKQLDKAISNSNWSVKEDEDLLEEVTFLVEYPKVIKGTFEEKFLKLPDEVLITVMREHQKYFPVIDQKNGRLVNRFLVVSNMDIEDTSAIRKGNERVLRARLTDAEFFFQSDRKRVFADLTDRLEEIVFQEKLGTICDKVKRVRKICSWLAPKLNFDAQVAKDADRAALLCKNDLLTEMVYEFPNLQGIMGREYAKDSGENEAVAQAIYEHYLPRHQEDNYPQSPVGVTLSIADKIDTICGCFGVGLIPTGSTDPYALRRQTNGILSVLLTLKKHLNLEQLVEVTLTALGELIKKPEETKSAVLDFIKARMNTVLVVKSRKSRYDLIEAVLASHPYDILDAEMRVEALWEMCAETYVEPLITSFKRVSRIIPPEAWDYQLRPDQLAEPAENSLWEAYDRIHEKAAALLEAREYNKALEVIAGLRENVDRFFDEVLVMAEEDDIRKNRLALLVRLALFFNQVADFSKIVVEGEKK